MSQPMPWFCVSPPGVCLSAAAIPVTILWAAPLLLCLLALVVLLLLLLRQRYGAGGGWEGSVRGALSRGQYLQHLTRLLRTIRAVNKIIVTERDRATLLRKACRALTRARGYKMAWIGEAVEEGRRVLPVAQAGFENGYLDEIRITWDETETGRGPTGQAIRTGEPSVMRDIESAPEYEPWREQALRRGYRSSASIPLRFEGRVLGALNVYSESPDAFDIQEVGLLQEVSDHIGYALGAIELDRELEEARARARRAEPGCAAFESAPVPVLTTGPDGRVTGLNRRARDLLGGREPADGAIGRRLADLDLPGPPLPAEGFSAIFAGDAAFEIRPGKLSEEEGTARVCWRAAPIWNGSGELEGSVWALLELSGSDGGQQQPPA